ncbi:MAG: helix-turn-helix domain-containing protein, partial [Actinomycetota bacterium]|nr:helix-turn-helix domain-containing protein [Actinomycetota bacterium]
GLTQQEVAARLARLGMRTSNRAVSDLERGAGLDAAKLPELADALDCSVTYLVGLTDDPRRWQPDTPAGSGRAPAQPGRPRRRAGATQPVVRPRQPWILGPDVPDRLDPRRVQV